MAEHSSQLVNGHMVLDTNYIIFRPGLTVSSTPTVSANDPSTERVQVLLRRLQGLNVSKDGVITHDTIRDDLKPIVVVGYGRQNPLYRTGSSKNAEANIDNFSSKLIIIDGKEASAKELKKLSAADIESMSSKTGAEMIKQYGDKAKGGVLFITTKKAK